MFDAHCHLHLVPDADRALAAATSVRRLAVCGTAESDWGAVAALAAAHPASIVPSYGVHPWYVATAASGWEARLAAALRADPRAGVGETGLDRAARSVAGFDAQAAATEAHAALALRWRRPLTLHCVRAAAPLAALLDRVSAGHGFPAGAVVHGWRGNADAARPLLAVPGVHLSLGARSVAGVAPGGLAWVPLDRVMLESDADGRSAATPADLPEVARAVATAMGVDGGVDALVAAATRNAERVFLLGG